MGQKIGCPLWMDPKLLQEALKTGWFSELLGYCNLILGNPINET